MMQNGVRERFFENRINRGYTKKEKSETGNMHQQQSEK